MTFHNVRLPTGYQYSSQFGAGFQTVIQQTASGHEVRIARQSQGKHRFRLRKQLQGNAEMAALKDFGVRMRGALDSFRVKDVSDFTTAADGVSAHLITDVQIGNGDGSKQAYQLVKWYNFGLTGAYPRTMTLPVAGTVLVAVGAAPQTLGVDFTLTDPGGVITFTVAPGLGVPITAGFEFDVPARFEKTMDQWTSISSDGTNLWSLPTLDLVEVLDEVEYPEKYEPGGVTNWGAMAADFTISLAQGTFHLAAPSVPINAFLPPPPTLHPGGLDVLVLRNDGGASTIQPRDDAGATVGGTIAANVSVVFDLLVTAGVATWYRR